MHDEERIKEVVARRAGELGARGVRPSDVTVWFLEKDAAPGCRVFHAGWGAGPTAHRLSGLQRDDDEPDTSLAQALGKVFRRWIETAGTLPDPAHVARVSAFLYDPANRHWAILTEEDKIKHIERPEWRSLVALPTLIEEQGQPGVAFWWVSLRGPSKVHVYLDERGTRTTETSIRDSLERGESESPA